MTLRRMEGWWLWVGGPVPPGAAAITLGSLVIMRPGRENDERLVRHELVHVAQYDRLGIFFFPAYGLASLGALIRGGHHYKDNRFERAARMQARR